jgi:beta-glucosidase
MCAYNRVDGQPACSNTRLLSDILRKQWRFDGYVVSDCGAIGDIYLRHKVAGTAAEGVAMAVKAGTDLNCGVEYLNLGDAVAKKLLPESDIDQAVRRLLRARFRLGMFDPPSMVRWAQIPYNANDSAAHRELALETARKSIVLLKNQDHTLPLSRNLKRIAVIGPNADDAPVMLGNYNGEPSEPVTPLEGIRRKAGPGTEVLYARGSGLAAGLPNFQVIPSSALFTANGPARRNGLNGEYFGSSNFDGQQHRPRELTYPSSGKLAGQVPQESNLVFTRIDPAVNFHWWDGAPRQDMDDDDFGVRWSGYLSAPVSGIYQLGAIGMNAFELYLDGKQLFQYNNIHERNYEYATVRLEAGKLHALRLDFHEFVNDADIQLVWSPPAVQETPAALEAARKSDAVILVMGLSPRLEGEEMKVPVEGFAGGDRVQIGIPRVQEELMRQVIALGKPVVLVLLNGSAVAVNWAHDHIPAIVEAWYPGQAGGTALADVLFGDYNPGGRLPVTFYRSADQLPPFTNYNMKGRTYRFFQGDPLYPFGHGLSYTTFAYHNLTLPAQADGSQPVKITVEVENSGAMAGEEVVQLYLRSPGAAWPRPLRSLEGFQRVALKPGERRRVEFTLTPRQLSLVAPDGRHVIEPGELMVSAGSAAGSLKISGATRYVE